MRDRRRLRLPVVAVFFVLGATVGSWAARVPAIKAGLHLSAGELGLALLGPAVGTVAAMPLTGALLATVAPRRLAAAGLVLVAGLLPLTALAGSGLQLFAVLSGWGVGVGVLDVSMNTEASAVQVRLGRRTMSRFHASYSVGGLIGAGTGAICAAAGITATADFAASGAGALLLGLAGTWFFDSAPAHQHHEASLAPGRQRRLPQWSLRLFALAGMAFACFLCEGAVSDWSAVYLRTSLGAAAAVAAIGYTAFSLAMTLGRLLGDRLADRVGPARLVRAAASVAALAFAAALAVGTNWSGLAGFTILGAGLSFTVPLVLTAASGLGRAGPNLAFTSGSGYLGMLVGPPLIGGLAAGVGLPAALGTIVALSALTAVLAGALVAPRHAGQVLDEVAEPGR